VGDNGAGKSSLLKVLNGEIALAESDITAVMILHISANLA
jgi:ATPase subunit of ABC transporter with duplicated ATPase domains